MLAKEMIDIKDFRVTKKLVYKFDVLAELKQRGYTSYILHDKLNFPMSSYMKLKHGVMVSNTTLLQICSMLDCKIEDVVDTVSIGEDPLA